jgi:serine phosphatase RsbU (regulator of sigma subunit)
MDDTRQVNRRLQQTYQQINQDQELARRVQQSLLPKALPEMPGVRMAVHHRFCGRPGGDCHDIFRLDQNHVAFHVGDTMAHGLAASLLALHVQNFVRLREASASIPPGEVLRRLNQEMVEQKLLENNFITMVYAQLNFEDGTVRFARAGHPLPLFFPAGGHPFALSVPGPVLGIAESDFPLRAQTLRPGDKLLLFTDGIDTLRFEGQEPGMPSLLACATRHRDLPVRNFVDAVAGDLLRQAEVSDDLTLLAVEKD